jgi:hypothetical protein
MVKYDVIYLPLVLASGCLFFYYYGIDVYGVNFAFLIVLPIIIYSFYIRYDHKYYQCSSFTHFFGIVLGIFGIIYHNMHFNSYDYFGIMMLSLSYSIFLFHAIYHIES